VLTAMVETTTTAVLNMWFSLGPAEAGRCALVVAGFSRLVPLPTSCSPPT
jgi:hypothetical protein